MPCWEIVENRKFLRLVRALAMPTPHVMGHLELMWRNAYLTDNPCYQREDVEIVAQWTGDDGVFVGALVAGGWLDEQPDGLLRVHDYEDHAPYFVKNKWAMRRSATTKNSKESNDVLQIVTKCNKVESFGTQEKRSQEKRREEKPILIARKDDPSETADPPPVDTIGVLKSLESLMAAQGDRVAETAKRAMNATNARPEWAPWISGVLESLGEHGNGGFAAAEEAIRRLEDAANPATRRAKDVGEFKEPLRWLVKQLTEACKARHIKWPAWPSGANNGRGG